jgi:hypothetical protein
MKDEPKAEPRPLFRWDQFRNLSLDFYGVRAFGQTQAAREARDMRIDGEARNVKGHAQHDIGRLSSDPRKGNQISHPRRNLTVKMLHQRSAAGNDRFRFDVEEAGWLDDAFHLERIGVGQRGGVWIPGEEPGGHGIDGAISGLRREDGGDQHLEWIDMVQL